MNHARFALASCLSLLLLGATSAAWADSPAAPPPPAPLAPTLSPEMEHALQQLNADSYEERQKAVAKIQQAFADQFKDVLVLEDPEAQARMATIMEFNDGLCRWALDALKLPMEQRRKFVAWGLSPEVAPVLAKVYSANVERRIDGVKDLANLKGIEVSALLTRLMNDDTREVYLAAMEAAWNREPTPEMIDVLWNRAVESGLAMFRPQQFINQPGVAGQVRFRGRVLGAMYAANNPYLKFQDNDIATDLLIQLKSPQVGVRVKTFFDKIQKDPAGQMAQMLLMPYNEPMKNVYRLLEAYKVKSIIPQLVELTVHPTQKNGNNFGNQGFFWSTRTAVFATVVKMTDQRPEDYKLKRMPQMNNMWTSPSEDAENESVKKFEQWWNEHKAEYVAAATAPAPDAASTQPALPAGPSGIAPVNPPAKIVPPRGAGAAAPPVPQPMPVQIQLNGGGMNVTGVITVTGNGAGQAITITSNGAGQVIVQQQNPPPPATEPATRKAVDGPAK